MRRFCCDANHVHAIVVLNGISVTDSTVGAGFKPATQIHANHGLAEIVRAFKTFSARRINGRQITHGGPVWQHNYFEHIIRNEQPLNRSRQCILDNPGRWEFDRENPWRRLPNPKRRDGRHNSG